MITKCPKCNQSDKVKSLQGFRSLVAAVGSATIVFVLGKGGEVVARNFSQKINSEHKYFCTRCKHIF